MLNFLEVPAGLSASCTCSVLQLLPGCTVGWMGISGPITALRQPASRSDSRHGSEETRGEERPWEQWASETLFPQAMKSYALISTCGVQNQGQLSNIPMETERNMLGVVVTQRTCVIEGYHWRTSRFQRLLFCSFQIRQEKQQRRHYSLKAPKRSRSSSPPAWHRPEALPQLSLSNRQRRGGCKNAVWVLVPPLFMHKHISFCWSWSFTLSTFVTDVRRRCERRGKAL